MPTQNFLPSSSGENSLGLPDLKFSDGYFNSGSFESGLITEAFYLRGRFYPHDFLTIDGLVEESSDINVEKYLNFPKWKSGINEGGGLSAETIYRNENVGIGTDNPSSRLHVEGNFLVTGDVSVKNFLHISSLDSNDFSLNNEDLIEKTNDAIASIYQESSTTSLLKNDGLNLVRLSSFHPKIVSEFSSLNDGRVYIQSIELDRYGHITGLSNSRELFTNTHVRKEKVEDLIESTILNGNEISIVKNSKGRLVVNSEHPFVNSCGNSFNSGRTYLQNLFFDEYGHCVLSLNSFEDLEAIDVISLITAQGNMSSSLSNNRLTLSSAHPNIAPVASDSSNPPRTYIQNIQLDEFGHVVSHASSSEVITTGDVTDAFLSFNTVGDNIQMSKLDDINGILISSSHEPISASSDSTNQGREYIQDIELDEFGHIIAINTEEESWSPRTDLEIYQTISPSIIDGSNISKSENSTNKETTISSSHISVQSANDSINSGRNYIKDITLDTYGHITSLSVGAETFFARTDDEINSLAFESIIKEGSNIDISSPSSSPLNGPLDNTNSFPNTKTLHLQHTSSNLSNIVNHGSVSDIHYSNMGFDEQNLLFDKGALKFSENSFLAFGWEASSFSDSQNFTIDFWVLKDFVNPQFPYEHFIATHSPATNPNWLSQYPNWAMRFNTNTLAFEFLFASGQTISSGSIVLGQWNHIALERKNGIIRFYFNGLIINSYSYTGGFNVFGLDGSKLSSFGVPSRNLGWFELGNIDGVVGDYGIFNGYIQDFRIIKGDSAYNGANFNSTRTISSTHSTKTVQQINPGSNRFIQNVNLDSFGHIDSISYKELTSDTEIINAFSNSLNGPIKPSENSAADKIQLVAFAPVPAPKPIGFIYLTASEDFDPNDFQMVLQVGNSIVSAVFDHNNPSMSNVSLDTKITFEKLSSGSSRVDYRSTNNTLHFKLNVNTLGEFATAFPRVGFLHVKNNLLSGNGSELFPFDVIMPIHKVFEGNWSLFAPGRTLIGAGTDPTLGNYSAQSTGGAKTHKLTIDEIPSHSHDPSPVHMPENQVDFDLGAGNLIMYLNSSNKSSYDGSNVWKDLSFNNNDMAISNVVNQEDDPTERYYHLLLKSELSELLIVIPYNSSIDLSLVTNVSFQSSAFGNSRMNIIGTDTIQILTRSNVSTFKDLVDEAGTDKKVDGIVGHEIHLINGKGLDVYEKFTLTSHTSFQISNEDSISFQEFFTGGLNFNNVNSFGSVSTKSTIIENYDPSVKHAVEMWVRFKPWRFKATMTLDPLAYQYKFTLTFYMSTWAFAGGNPPKLFLEINGSWINFVKVQNFPGGFTVGGVHSFDFTTSVCPTKIRLDANGTDGIVYRKLTIKPRDTYSSLHIGSEVDVITPVAGDYGVNGEFGANDYCLDLDSNARQQNIYDFPSAAKPQSIFVRFKTSSGVWKGEELMVKLDGSEGTDTTVQKVFTSDVTRSDLVLYSPPVSTVIVNRNPVSEFRFTGFSITPVNDSLQEDIKWNKTIVASGTTQSIGRITDSTHPSKEYQINPTDYTRWWLGTFGGSPNGVHYLRNQFGKFNGDQFSFNLGNDKNWHHIVYQVDNNKRASWFKDGQLVHTADNVSLQFQNNLLLINPFIDGTIPNVDISTIRLWDDGLALNAVQFLYTMGPFIHQTVDPWLAQFDIRQAVDTATVGGDQPHNNLQPYTVVKMWKRDS
jgi:microcystin-dependent protein